MNFNGMYYPPINTTHDVKNWVAFTKKCMLDDAKAMEGVEKGSERWNDYFSNDHKIAKEGMENADLQIEKLKFQLELNEEGKYCIEKQFVIEGEAKGGDREEKIYKKANRKWIQVQIEFWEDMYVWKENMLDKINEAMDEWLQAGWELFGQEHVREQSTEAILLFRVMAYMATTYNRWEIGLEEREKFQNYKMERARMELKEKYKKKMRKDKNGRKSRR